MAGDARVCNNIPSGMATILCLLRSIFAQGIVVFYPGVFVFWLIVHNNIERLRAWGTRAYWVAAIAWLATSGPLLLFRREIFSVRWVMRQPFAGLVAAIGAAAFALAILTLSKA